MSSIAAALATLAAAGPMGTAATAGQVGAQPVPDDGPRLLRFMYGLQGPSGSPFAFLGLRIATFDLDGRVLMVDVDELEPARMHLARLQRGCLPDESNGVFHTWVLPGALAPGRYRFKILLYSATCVSGDARPQMRRMKRVIEVPASAPAPTASP